MGAPGWRTPPATRSRAPLPTASPRFKRRRPAGGLRCIKAMRCALRTRFVRLPRSRVRVPASILRQHRQNPSRASGGAACPRRSNPYCRSTASSSPRPKRSPVRTSRKPTTTSSAPRPRPTIPATGPNSPATTSSGTSRSRRCSTSPRRRSTSGSATAGSMRRTTASIATSTRSPIASRSSSRPTTAPSPASPTSSSITASASSRTG